MAIKKFSGSIFATPIKRIESCLANSREFYAAVSDENEDRATVFVTSHGGVGVVQMVSARLVILSIPDPLSSFRTAVFWNSYWPQQFPSPGILRAVKELRRRRDLQAQPVRFGALSWIIQQLAHHCGRASFLLKFQFALEQRIDI